MKQVMVRAWEIAKGAVAKFGGKVREYLAEALRQAWAEIKAVKTPFRLRNDKKGKRTWLAKITGTHPTYKLARTFIETDETDWLGNKYFELENGYYQYDNSKERGYVKVENGNWKDVSYQEVLSVFA